MAMKCFDKEKTALICSSWGCSFIVTLFFLSFAASLFWLDNFRSYEAKISILVIGKSASINPETVAANLVTLTETLSFYERILANTDKYDIYEGFSSDKRKALWNEAVRAKHIKNSSVLTLDIIDASDSETRLLVKDTVQTLLATAGFYYNIRTDIDLRVIDGPFVKTVISKPFIYMFVSFGTGIITTVVFFIILNIIPRLFKSGRQMGALFTSHKNEAHEEEFLPHVNDYPMPYIDPRKFLPSRPSGLTFENLHNEEETASAKIPSTKAAAPQNLPIADNDYIATLATNNEPPYVFQEISLMDEKDRLEQKTIASQSASSASEEQKILEEIMFPENSAHIEYAEPRVSNKEPDFSSASWHGEPSVDEYKRRLNELLDKGK